MTDTDTPSLDPALAAAAFNRLVQHLQQHPEVPNIELMLLADFCRNCLAKWYAAAAQQQGKAVDYEQARELIYGMPYETWKTQHQADATPEQLAAFARKQAEK